MNRKQRRQAISGKGGGAGILAPGVAQERLAEGRRLMRAGRLADAATIARQLHKAALGDGYTLHLLGTIAGRGGNRALWASGYAFVRTYRKKKGGSMSRPFG